VKLYVCWGAFKMPGEAGHPCEVAHRALKDAGHRPKLVRGFGAASLPSVLGILNHTPGRRAVKRLTGTIVVPALVTDTGEVVHESENIVAWALANPATNSQPARR
jgi:hypothetical protein